MFRTTEDFVVQGQRLATPDILEEGRLCGETWRGLGDALTEYGYGAEERAAFLELLVAHRDRWQARVAAEGPKQAKLPAEARSLADANTWSGTAWARLKKLGRKDQVVAKELQALERDRKSTEVSAAELRSLAGLLAAHQAQLPGIDAAYLARGAELAAALPVATDSKTSARKDVSQSQRELDEHDGRIYTDIVDFYEAARHYARTHGRRDLLPQLCLQVLNRQAAATAGRSDPAPVPSGQ